MRLVFVILNEVKNLAHPTDKILRCAQDDKIRLSGEIEGTVSFVQFVCIVPTIRHYIVTRGKMASHGGLEARQESRWSKFPVLPIAPYMNAIGTGRRRGGFKT